MKTSLYLRELVDAAPGFAELRSLKLNAKLSYQIAKLGREMDEHLKDYTAARNKLLEDLGEPIEGKPGEFKPTPQLVKEMDSLLDQVVHLWVVPIPLSTFDNMDVSAQMFLSLPWLIKEDEDCKPKPAAESQPTG